MAVSLEALCNDLHRYAAVISVPANMMPGCNVPNRGGLNLALTSDGKRYVLTYTEKDVTDTLLVSNNADKVLEATFDELTLNLAAQRGATQTVGTADPLATPPMPPPGHMFDFEIKLYAAQEALLSQINPAWAERQNLRNVRILKEKKKRFGG